MAAESEPIEWQYFDQRTGTPMAAIREGDLVKLQWNGYPGVPRALSGTTATVLRKMRLRVLVEQKPFGKLTIHVDQIAARAINVPGEAQTETIAQ